MDVHSTAPEPADVDPKRLLETDIERARAERDDLVRAMEADRDRLRGIRAALDAMAASVWSDVFRQQIAARSRVHWSAALTLGWFGGYRFALIGLMLVMGTAATLALGPLGVAFDVAAYAALAAVAYGLARSGSVALIKKQRQYLGNGGKDMRFVAFTHVETGLRHPYIGKDGPNDDASMEERSWKIPGVREQEALNETLLEVMDERRNAIVLSRFPDKKPTLVHADLENPFIRPYGVYLQRAIERQLPAVEDDAQEFRHIVLRSSKLHDAEARVVKLEAEMREFEGTMAILGRMPVLPAVRSVLARQVVLFRLDDPATRRGMLLHASGSIEVADVVQSLALAAGATVVPLLFSHLKIGYVGQGAARVGRAFEAARRQRSIVYIPDCDALFTANAAEGYDAMRREVAQAVTAEWAAMAHEPDVWIVAATLHRDRLDPGLAPHFGSIVALTPQIDAPTERMNVAVESPGAGDVSDDSWDSVALPVDSMEHARLLAAMMMHADDIADQGLEVPRGLIVHGRDGDDVADVAHAVAQHSGLAVVTTGVAGINEALERAREFGSAIVLLKYVEDLSADTASALAALLDEFRQRRIRLFILATAANLADVHPEIRLRLPDSVEVRAPDAPVRESMLRQLLSGKHHEVDLEQAIAALVQATGGMSRRAVRAALTDAISRAAENLSPDRSPNLDISPLLHAAEVAVTT